MRHGRIYPRREDEEKLGETCQDRFTHLVDARSTSHQKKVGSIRSAGKQVGLADHEWDRICKFWISCPRQPLFQLLIMNAVSILLSDSVPHPQRVTSWFSFAPRNNYDAGARIQTKGGKISVGNQKIKSDAINIRRALRWRGNGTNSVSITANVRITVIGQGYPKNAALFSKRNIL